MIEDHSDKRMKELMASYSKAKRILWREPRNLKGKRLKKKKRMNEWKRRHVPDHQREKGRKWMSLYRCMKEVKLEKKSWVVIRKKSCLLLSTGVLCSSLSRTLWNIRVQILIHIGLSLVMSDGLRCLLNPIRSPLVIIRLWKEVHLG